MRDYWLDFDELVNVGEVYATTLHKRLFITQRKRMRELGAVCDVLCVGNGRELHADNSKGRSNFIM